MVVRFRCGHEQAVPINLQAAPICLTCGERVVSRVMGARPRFVGACVGPFAETKAVEPAVVSFKKD